MKKLLSLLLAVAMLLSLTSLAFAEDEITITVFHYMAQDAKQAGLDAIEASYSELHPNVIFPLGISTEIFFRLWPLAPITLMDFMYNLCGDVPLLQIYYIIFI